MHRQAKAFSRTTQTAHWRPWAVHIDVSHRQEAFPPCLQEHEHLRLAVERIMIMQPDVLLVEKSVARFAQEMLLGKGVALILNVKPSLLERLARCTGAQVQPRALPACPQCCASCCSLQWIDCACRCLQDGAHCLLEGQARCSGSACCSGSWPCARRVGARLLSVSGQACCAGEPAACHRRFLYRCLGS